MIFDISDWKRFEWEGTPIYFNSKEPDWFVPNSSGDRLLRDMRDGKKIEIDFITRKFIKRLPHSVSSSYSGRGDYLAPGTMKELWFHLTNKCNLSCSHCLFSSSPATAGELTAGQVLGLVKEAYDMGCKVFAFTGGEPFLHDDIIPIIENITAVFSQETQLVTLSWDAATYRDLYEYVIFRDREGTTQPGTQPIAVTTETTWIDSTASEDNSSTAPFRYRVVIRDNGMELGPSHGFSRVEVPYHELTAYFSADVDSVFPDEEIELYLMATSSPTAIKNVLFFTGNDILYENTFTEDDSVFEYENNPITITVPESDSPWFILECSVENFDGLTSYDSLLLKYMHEDSDPDPAPLVPDTVDTPDETSFNTDVQTETDIRIVPVFMSPERNSEFHYRTIANLKSIEQKRIIFDSKQKTDRV